LTVSILETLAILPSGDSAAKLDVDELSSYLVTNYNTDAEKDRNARHCLRDELYRDGGIMHMTAFIDSVFLDKTVRELRKKWIRYARFNNAIKRIVNELSTVYSEPARRMVSDADGNERYLQILKLVRMDERMIEVSRLVNLHRALLVGFRIRVKPDGTREPVIDVATPSNVRAVMHPNDSTEVIGWMIRTEYRTARKQVDNPKWTLWTDHESVQLRENLSVIGGTYRQHNIGMCPWVPVALIPPPSGFWPGHEGEDLVAAHVAIWFQNILTLKEAKSATKQTILQGDGTVMARGQAADSEVPIELADGQSASTVDMSMDLAAFRETTDHILRHTAQNYGMSPALIEHQGVQSAEARELMRMPLRELRRQQQVPLRIFEEQFAKVMAAVCGVDMTELAFSADGWRIEYAESETPLDPLSEQTLFEKRRAAGLDNTYEMLKRMRPGLTDEGAEKLVIENVRIETKRNELMRPLQSISGSMGAETPDGPAEDTPESGNGTEAPNDDQPPQEPDDAQ